MRKSFIAILPVLLALTASRVCGQPHGDSIFGNASTVTNAVAATMTNSIAASSTNSPTGDFVGFDQLSGFLITMTPDLEVTTNSAQGVIADAKINAMIPKKIMALDGHRISVDGFMVPLDYRNGRIVEFMLSRDQAACCFGANPRCHEWVKVDVKGGVDWISDVPVRVRGILHIGARRVDGILCGVYSMDADTVAEAPAK